MMKKITMKISKLVLLIIVGCFFGGYATNAFSGDNAKDWGNANPNSAIDAGVLLISIKEEKASVGCVLRTSFKNAWLENHKILPTRCAHRYT
jgi:hypothetical protein